MTEMAIQPHGSGGSQHKVGHGALVGVVKVLTKDH